MDRQQLYRRRLAQATGARVRLDTRGESGERTTIPGVWQVEGDRFLVQQDPAPTPPATSDDAIEAATSPADVLLELPTGVHGFSATVRPRAHGLWEILTHGPITVRESRAHIRVSGPIPAWLSPTDDSAARTPVTVDDLALGGVAFRSHTELLVGAPWALHFPLDGSDPLGPLHIEVVRCAAAPDGFQCGAQFTELPPGAVERWIDVLARAKRQARRQKRPSAPRRDHT